MTESRGNSAENPFVQLKVRRLVLWLLLLSLPLGFVQASLAEALQISPTDPIWTLVIYIVLMVSLCLLVLREFDRLQVELEDVAGRLPDRPGWPKLAGLIVAILLASMGLFLVSFYLISLSAPQFIETLLRQVETTSTAETAFPRLTAILMPFVYVVIAPITEEFLFRGIILQRWATKWGIRPALIASSIAFGVLHANFVGLTIFGLAMGLLYVRTRSLMIPIVCHAFNNALASASLYLPGTNESSDFTSLQGLQQGWWVGLILIAISAPILLLFIRANYPHRDALIPYLANRADRQAAPPPDRSR